MTLSIVESKMNTLIKGITPYSVYTKCDFINADDCAMVLWNGAVCLTFSYRFSLDYQYPFYHTLPGFLFYMCAHEEFSCITAMTIIPGRVRDVGR